MSVLADREKARLEKEEQRRMEIYGYQYKPLGGWDSPEDEAAYKRAWRESPATRADDPAPKAKKPRRAEEPERPKEGKRKSKRGKHDLSADLFTEGGIGAAFLKDHGDELVSVREWKSWAGFQLASGQWIKIGSEEVTTRLLDWFERGLFQAAQRDKKISKSKKTMTKVRRFRELTPCNNAARYASGKDRVSSSIFDRNKDTMLSASGAVALKKGKKRAAKPSDYFTRSTVEYEPGYTDPLWDEILSAFPEGVADYLQIIVGNALTGHTLNESKVFFLTGDGSNGKSTFTDVVKKMMGTYADRVDSSLLLSAGDSNLFAKAKLKGLRAAFIEELPKSNWLDALIIKELAETAEMTAAKKFQDEETFDFTATVFVNTNYLPQVSENDRGTWRRLAPIPMPYTYVSAAEYDAAEDPEALGLRKKNPALANAANNPSILKAALAWGVEGSGRWYEAGKVEGAFPEPMQAEFQKWRGSQDKIGLWWDERIVADPNSFCLVSDLHDTFELEMAEVGRPAEKTRKFVELLQAHQLFKEAGAEYVQRQRVPGDLIQSTFTPEKKSTSKFEPDPTTRYAKGPCFFVRGIRFRDESDDVEITVPDNASELTAA